MLNTAFQDTVHLKLSSYDAFSSSSSSYSLRLGQTTARSSHSFLTYVFLFIQYIHYLMKKFFYNSSLIRGFSISVETDAVIVASEWSSVVSSLNVVVSATASSGVPDS